VTVFDMQAQLNAAAAAQSTIMGRSVVAPQLPRSLPTRPTESKKG
jgi:hypothetical protein